MPYPELTTSPRMIYNMTTESSADERAKKHIQRPTQPTRLRNNWMQVTSLSQIKEGTVDKFIEEQTSFNNKGRRKLVQRINPNVAPNRLGVSGAIGQINVGVLASRNIQQQKMS